MSPPTVVRFEHAGPFSKELKSRVDDYFADGERSRRDLPRMYLKTAVILAWFVGSWALLVFAHTNAWQATLLAISLGLSVAAVGMGIQHDANHGAYSNHRWVNRTLGFTLDVMGVCSFIWRQKHNVIHHAFTNVQGVDYDLDFGSIARISSEQRRRAGHRYQHLYMWFLYGLLLPKWVFWDDFVILFSRKIANHDMPALSRKETALFWGYKIFFVGWSMVIPALFHPIWQVAIFHLVAVFALGVTLSTAFQLAHCVEEARFPSAPPVGDALQTDWNAHQVETTVDFARGNRPLAWFLGGLSFQVEHHLFPKICHLHYEALSHIVEEVAAKHGVNYQRNGSVRGAIASHYRHLKKLGQPALA
ncbi:MAG: fatty acid desaturase family protein [Polyangiales bacterium]